MTDPVQLAKALIACPSVTPATGEVFDVLGAALVPLGFATYHFLDGGPPHGPVENMVAIRWGSGPHLAFAGHLDVVPGGEGWTAGAFNPVERGGLLYGRGAVDMKGGIAAFVAAAAATQDVPGTVSLLITGDEEGPGAWGTRSIMRWLEEKDIRPDHILTGEPTCEARLGDTVKIGRRGSANFWVTIPGREGHVAYPHRADNPLRRLPELAGELRDLPLDDGSRWFQPSNLEITDIRTGNDAANVIPPSATIRFNIRFNDRQQGPVLEGKVRAIAEKHGATVEVLHSGEAFVTEPGELAATLTDAIRAETGLTPELSTSGGTSDARFLHKLAPVAEFGLVNATMHKRDEAASVDDLHALARIYAATIRGLSSPGR